MPARVLDGTGVAGVAAAGEAQVLTYGLAGDLTALVEDPGNRRGVGVGYVALQDGRPVHHRDASHANDVLDRDPLPAQEASVGTLERAAPAPRVERVLRRIRAVPARPWIDLTG